MNTNMHGKAISQIWWINDHGDSCVRASNGKTLTFSATYHGDHDEFWVIELEDGKDVARHNCKHIATITWDVTPPETDDD